MNISNTFQEQGFVQGIPLLSKNSVVKLRRHVERAEREIQENEQLCSQLNHPLQKIFQSLARHPVIVRYVSQLIGPNILVRNGDVFIKGPKAVHIIPHFTVLYLSRDVGMFRVRLGCSRPRTSQLLGCSGGLGDGMGWDGRRPEALLHLQLLLLLPTLP